MDQEHKNQLGYFGRVSGRDKNKRKSVEWLLIMKMLLLILKRVQRKVMGKSDFDQKSVDENVYEWYQKEGVHSQYYGEIVKVLVKDYK